MSDRKKFKKWMKKQGAWDLYKARYNKGPLNSDRSRKSFLSDRHPKKYIATAFKWRELGVPSS